MNEKTRLFECPHCKGSISVSIRTEILGVNIPEEEGNIDWSAGLSDEEKRSIDVARDSGVLDAFGRVVEYNQQYPKSIERFFLNFLRNARPRTIPSFAIRALFEEFPTKRVNVVQGDGVIAVIVEGAIRRFIPLKLAAGESLGGSSKLRTSADQTEYHNWLSAERPFSANKAFNFNQI